MLAIFIVFIAFGLIVMWLSDQLGNERVAAIAVSLGHFALWIGGAGAVLWILFSIFTTSASAQPACGPWNKVRAMLQEGFGETEIGGGQVDEAIVVRVFISVDGASFSIVTVERDGRTCLLATGSDWDPGKLPGEPAPAGRS